jgi:hypothetical protein
MYSAGIQLSSPADFNLAQGKGMVVPGQRPFRHMTYIYG